ncbi:MFS transporter [Convivina praedatoris]|uniref:Transport protein HsrA n=1 Tax=Convivina praedatoris TaxID=2880963 RepID=A0ABM9D2Z0_9LACO|nr:MFS transporter [Convivina sp. LMG 32447]CAH1855982.1 putative transport protein HsrA [Convivina sp. LMG 32447]CAH1856482.1 putative transport protein HsrA [Convivina sp. LMG 32447]CAH1857321.1 putative transport protein HsrA [Convivina sp. LMG 32447]
MDNQEMTIAQLKQATLVVAAAFFMQMLDSTIVTTALPRIANDLSVSQSSASLVISSYLLASAVFIPLSGWLARIFQRRTLFLGAVTLFTISSGLGGLATTLPMLLCMRIIQGMAGSLMIPVGRLMILAHTPAPKLLQILSYLIWPALIAPAIAPLLGGYIITYLDWHWIFYINIPIGLLILLTGHWAIRDHNKPEQNPFDLLGFLLVSITGVSLLISSEILSHGMQSLLLGLLLLIGGIVAGLGAFYHLKHAKHPLFSLDALKIPSFRVYQSGGTIFWMTIGALPYLLTLFLQIAFGWNAVQAGSYVLFIFLGNLIIKPFTTPIIQRLGYRRTIATSLIVATLSTFGFAFLTRQTNPILIVSLAFISGIGRSLALTGYNGLSFSELQSQQKNSANTLQAVVQMLSQGLGIGFSATLVAIFEQFSSVRTSYSMTFICIGIISIYAIVEILHLQKDVGAQTLNQSET